ncbi:hypothetical protein BST81_19035 [Leptolyngbya sp. 'hensonii']|uniref:hypothetical protein n=1 Tax=Leptolyngbya sp. 'hensonii' TaxID=1922337 RepID=UPI0009503311|nr:hypothetical protein [Leptolyngbya sp. 'hensonii']OLP16791.1 hypothetical protein BST81_19035 [Leptolyngbya sp. 'hensonii']
MKKQALWTLAALILAMPVLPVSAQIADVSQPDGNGNFKTARILGNRGYYLQRKWLIVEPDKAGVNCRNKQGKVLVRIAYGAVVDSVVIQTNAVMPRPPLKANWDAIEVLDGKPWVYVRVNLLDVQQTLGNRQNTYTCYVRAHRQYIAPINEDQL